jgi:hypothetical protein
MAEQLIAVREQPVQFVGSVANNFHFKLYRLRVTRVGTSSEIDTPFPTHTL